MLPTWVFNEDDHRLMKTALREAQKAAHRGDVPVGAVLTSENEIVTCAGNRREADHDPCGHAEILVLREAGRLLGDWRLEKCTLYVSLEPCPMCLEACRQARIELLIWGATDTRMGACGGAVDLSEEPRLGPPVAHRGGLLAEESEAILKDFFAKRRVSS